MRKETIISILILLLIWLVSAMMIQNDIILPMPTVVLTSFIEKIGQPVLYSSILITLKRILIGFSLSFSIALICACLADYSKSFAHYFAPIDHLLKTIPNISYIILSLIWLGQEKSVILVIFLVVFPIMYAAIKQGLTLQDLDLVNAMQLYGKNDFYNLKVVKLPLSVPTILLGVNASLTLGFKVGIMAEILNQTKGGLGYQLYLAKVNLDMVNLFSWTIWIIIVGVLLNWLINKLIKLVNNIS